MSPSERLLDEKNVKMWKKYQHLLSYRKSLGKLRKFGFKTFDGFIDESYDEEENNLIRTKMIFDELDKLIFCKIWDEKNAIQWIVARKT